MGFYYCKSVNIIPFEVNLANPATLTDRRSQRPLALDLT
jgi:hypothetical protein